MGEITFIRHGQANSQADTEAGYDRLSDLGWQQARWLGEHLRAHEPPFDRVLTGTLRRHLETAEAMGEMGAAPTRDARLNEMDYYNLARVLKDSQGVPMPTPDDFAVHIQQVLHAWHQAEIEGNESFASFETRISGVLAEAAEPGVRVLCVTSGGVIGMILRRLLDLDPERMGHVLLPIRNSSVHRVQVMPHGTILAGFNATPHLDAPDRAHARTTY
jgi:broad specificity phosphatase PhoE